ncbi:MULTISPECIES: hypothetical protein [Halorhodospira]|uniref:phage tail fiber protein n=1 Tax=Halorhodospira TaxID=85108 RepID=UPI0019117708|nr:MULTISPECIES: hypothetical protein [Halorhodospira]MBK5943319.1 hypothetical protein [Halorhodospira halophila]MCG5526844.1 hypothetical protein [Halorhodospira halophila]MCG5542819.1 hypothetical protein [Halorhodospira sp. 9628]
MALDHVFRSGTVYLAARVGGSEVSGNGHSRQAASFGAPTAASSSGRAVFTNADVEFSEATGTWGEVDEVAVYDASSGGTRLAIAPLATAREILEGDILRFPAGEVQVSID